MTTPRDQLERDLRDAYERERAEHQARGDERRRQGALVQRRAANLQVSLREYRALMERELPRGRLYVRPEYALAGDQHAIEYANPGTLAGLFKADRDRAEAEHGPIGPMRELVARRSTPDYQANLRGLVESAATHRRLLTWNIEPMPIEGWSSADTAEWVSGHLALIADARAINPAVEQAAYRIPYGDPAREARLRYALDATTGGTMAADAGLNAGYWVDAGRLPDEQAKYAGYLAAQAWYRPLVAALDYVSVHGYQQSLYPPAAWSAVEFARAAAAAGKPILLWLSPRERGRSDTGWVDLAHLEDLVAAARAHDASIVWWVNGADMQDQSAEMRERFDIVRGGD